jgi:hypothetical protein
MAVYLSSGVMVNAPAWMPLAEAKGSAGIPEADRRAIQSAIAEWEGRTKKPRRRRTK